MTDEHELIVLRRDREGQLALWLEIRPEGSTLNDARTAIPFDPDDPEAWHEAYHLALARRPGTP